MLAVDNKFSHGDIVYLITDIEQIPRMVTSVLVNKYDLLYEVICGTHTSRHYDYELSLEKNILLCGVK